MRQYITKKIIGGVVFALAVFGTTILAVAISGTITTWTTGQVLKSSDLNTTISSLKTAIEGITSSQWVTSGSSIYRTGGRVGIGLTSPNTSSILDVMGDVGAPLITLRYSNSVQSVALSTGSTGGSISLYDGSGTQRTSFIGDPGFNSFINNGGNFGIGTTSPSQMLTVNGNAGNTTGVWVNNSDERLKKNIQPLGNYLEKLTELRPVTFEWKDPKKLNAKEGKHIGFIAQEVEKVFPYWVDTDRSGMKWLSMEGVNAAFVQSFKEVALRLRSLELGSDSIRVVTQKVESLEKEKAVNEKKLMALEESNQKLFEDNKRLRETVETLRASVETHGRASLRLEDRLRAIENLQMARK